MTRSSRIRIALAALATATCGCGTEYRLTFTLLTDPPGEVVVTDDLIEIPADVAIGVHAQPIENDRRVDDHVDLVPSQAGIIGLDDGLADNDLVIYGISPGSTMVDIYFDEDWAGTLRASVGTASE